MSAEKGSTDLAPAIEPVEATFVELRGGLRMPLLGFGTFRLRGEECAKAVAHALSVGYRHIDTASVYQNESDVAEGLRRSGLLRSDVWITSKLQPKDQGEKAYEACIETLRRLDTDYLDLYLVHWPGASGMQGHDARLPGLRRQTWEALMRLHAEGRVRAVGVSNYLPRHLDELCAPGAGDWATLKPVVNQFELHPMLQQADIVAACARYGVAVEAYSSLGQGVPELLEHPVVAAVAAAHARTPAQVLLRWAVQRGWTVLPKSASPARIEENARVFGWALSAADVTALDALGSEEMRMAWDPRSVTA